MKQLRRQYIFKHRIIYISSELLILLILLLCICERWNHTQIATMSDTTPESAYTSFKYFLVRFPKEHEYVVHVEINRAEKLNAFIEACVL